MIFPIELQNGLKWFKYIIRRLSFTKIYKVLVTVVYDIFKKQELNRMCRLDVVVFTLSLSHTHTSPNYYTSSHYVFGKLKLFWNRSLISLLYNFILTDESLIKMFYLCNHLRAAKLSYNFPTRIHLRDVIVQNYMATHVDACFKTNKSFWTRNCTS